MDWVEQVRERVWPVAGGVRLSAVDLWVVVGAGLAAVLVPVLWHRLRLAVTLVHELGHALVGMAVGRRFVGFVLRGDMSGQAVTSGPARGPGRVATTWAGYPVPALLAAALVWLAVHGWGAPALTVAALVLLLALTRVRSVLTALVVGAALAGAAAAWWWRDDAVQQGVLVAVGTLLLLGGWRHLSALARDRSRTSDPAVLGSLTHLPAALWTLSFVLVQAGATWVVAGLLVDAVRRG